MAPKTNCNIHKLAAVHTWFQRSRAVWTIKDLEKQLPSIASVNSMQVKDYVQNLQDDGKLNCEKVGSTNWLWSFPSEGKKITYSAFEAAQKDHAKAHDGVMALRQKIAERAAELDQEQGESEGAGESRDELTTHQATLEAELQTMRRELRSYSDDDPTEIEHKGLEAKRLFEEATAYTEDIYTLEDYFKKQGVPTEQMTTIQVGIYGDEFDTEEYALRELLFEE